VFFFLPYKLVSQSVSSAISTNNSLEVQFMGAIYGRDFVPPWNYIVVLMFEKAICSDPQ
jgi:hypothetical protein